MNGQPQNNQALPLLRFVVDSNVWIDAYSNEGNKKRENLSREALNKASSNGIIIYTDDTRKDLKNALYKAVNSGKIKREAANVIWNKFIKRAFLVENKAPRKEYEKKHFAELSMCKDKDDWVFLALADENKALYIISNDAHLLNMEKYKDIKIVAPATFNIYEKLPPHRQPDNRRENQRDSGQRR